MLVVDDEPGVVRLLDTMLERGGYTVTTASDSRSALERVRRDPAGFDLVITDEGLPGLSGTQLAAAIHDLRDDLPVVLCSGDAPHTSHHQAPGVQATLAKPFDARQLLDLLTIVLERG